MDIPLDFRLGDKFEKDLYQNWNAPGFRAYYIGIEIYPVSSLVVYLPMKWSNISTRDLHQNLNIPGLGMASNMFTGKGVNLSEKFL